MNAYANRPTFGAAIGSLLNVVIVTSSAAEKVVKAADNLASVAEETSGMYLERTRIQNRGIKAMLEGELKALEDQIATGNFKAQPQLSVEMP